MVSPEFPQNSELQNFRIRISSLQGGGVYKISSIPYFTKRGPIDAPLSQRGGAFIISSFSKGGRGGILFGSRDLVKEGDEMAAGLSSHY
jgi:hypothetical protein